MAKKTTEDKAQDKDSNKDKDKHAGGCPPKYTPDMPDRLRSYIARFEEHGDAIPSRPGFAAMIGVCEKTIENWGKRNVEFLRALGELKAAQHKELLNKGLTCRFSSTIAKLILSSNHGHKERTDQTSDDKPLEAPKVILSSDVVKKKGNGKDGIQPKTD